MHNQIFFFSYNSNLIEYKTSFKNPDKESQKVIVVAHFWLNIESLNICLNHLSFIHFQNSPLTSTRTNPLPEHTLCNYLLTQYLV